MNAGLLTGAIFVDFCKTFDTIDHKILLDKLQLFGICGSEHYLWIMDYRTHHTQSVFVGGVLSSRQQSCFWSSARFYTGPVAIFIVCR